MKTKHIIAFVIAVFVLAVVIGSVWWSGKVAKAPAVSTLTPTSTSEMVATSTTPSTTTSTIVKSSSTGTTSGSGMTISIQKGYGGSSFSLNYPDAWSVATYKPFSIDTFNGKYDNDGVIPSGGAVIDIATTTVYGSLQDIINTELMSATAISNSTQTIGKIQCTKASYHDEYAPGFTSQNIAFYCQRGTELWKIYFSYRANDPAASTHIADFNKIIASLKFLP